MVYYKNKNVSFIGSSPGQRFCEAVVFERKRGWPTIRARKKKGNCPRVTKMKIIAKKTARDVVGEIIDAMGKRG